MLKKGQCIYHIGQPGDYSDDAKCGKPAGYTMERDDDDNKYRKYRPFCLEHQAKVDAQRKANPNDY